MNYRAWVFVGGFSSIFFFLPSLAVKLGRLIWGSSWQVKSILIYGLIGICLVSLIRRRLLWKRAIPDLVNDVTPPLLIVQRRLAEGKISLDEYRQIKQELQ